MATSTSRSVLVLAMGAEQSLLDAFVATARNFDVELVRAHSADEALELLASREPAAVVSARGALGSAGVDYLRCARRRWPGARVLLCDVAEPSGVDPGVELLKNPFDANEAARLLASLAPPRIS